MTDRGVRLTIWFKSRKLMWIRTKILGLAFKVTGLHYKTEAFPLIKEEWDESTRAWWRMNNGH